MKRQDHQYSIYSMKRAIVCGAMAVLSAGVILTLPVVHVQAAENQTQNVNSTFGTALMPGVNEYMLRADFWGTNDDLDKILLNSGQIYQFNLDNIAKKETNMHNLAAEPETFDGIALRQTLSNLGSPDGLYLNDQPLEQSYLDNLSQNILAGAAQNPQQIRYGIITERTVMKTMPSDDLLADGVGDIDWDQTALSPVLMNEPVLIYHITGDGRWCYVTGEICSGWIPTSDVAICHTREEWLNAQNFGDQFVVVTGSTVTMEETKADPDHSQRSLEMGTILKLTGTNGFIDNRMSWYSYVVYFPTRDADGYYKETTALIPMSQDVTKGYLPLTKRNLINQAMKCLGNRYGWGGSLNAQDCSSFVREIYLCCGMKIARNTTWQAAMPAKTIDLSGMTLDEKRAVFNQLPAGAIVQFNGHEMLYLGKNADDYYTINDVSSLVMKNPAGENVKCRVRTVVINGLINTKRANQHTWMEDVNRVIIPWEK